MKFLVLVTIFLIGIYAVQSCQPEWYNKCKVHSDCCSGNCERPEYWEFGVCKRSKFDALLKFIKETHSS